MNGQDTADPRGQPQGEPPRRRAPPLQFGLRSLLGITASVAVLFGTLRWLNVSARASAMVLLIIVVGTAAALALVAAIAAAADHRQ